MFKHVGLFTLVFMLGGLIGETLGESRTSKAREQTTHVMELTKQAQDRTIECFKSFNGIVDVTNGLLDLVYDKPGWVIEQARAGLPKPAHLQKVNVW